MKGIDWVIDGDGSDEQTRMHAPITCFVNPAGPDHKDFRLELRNVLDSVYQQHGKLSVMYSGGADSEMLVRELHSMKLPFETHFIKFTNQSNQVDYEFATQVQDELGFNMYVHSHNVEQYVANGNHVDDGLRFLCTDLSVLAAYRIAAEVQMPTLMGPELLLQKHQRVEGVMAGDEWYIILGEHSTSSAVFTKRTSVPMYGELYFETPQLLHSILQWPDVQDLLNGKYPGRISMSYVKNPMMEKALGYKFTVDKKRHGYEACYHTFRRGVTEVEAALPFQLSSIKLPVIDVLPLLEQQ